MRPDVTLRRSTGSADEDLRHDVQETEVAVCEELDEIERRRVRAGCPAAHSADPCGEALEQRADRLNLTALCLSGGGIRSAAFCLGVLQSLAKKRRLNDFDYLSTVSGGGFIGGWLQVLMQQSPSIEHAQATLADNLAPPLKRLRAFTNYLTPQTGPFSTDTWAGIVLYLRNLILNWMVFAPLFLLLALAPILYRTLLASLRGTVPQTAGILTLATIAVVIGSWQACNLLPSHQAGRSGFSASRFILHRIVLPSLVWAVLAPTVVNDDSDHAIFTGVRDAWLVPFCYAGAMLAGYGIAWAVDAHRANAEGADRRNADKAERAKRGHLLYRKNALRWAAATVFGFLLTALAIFLTQPPELLYQIATLKPFGDERFLLVDRASAFAAFGPLWFMGTHVLHTTFYVGLRKEAVHADLDREWLGRLNGILLLIGAAWTVFALSCLILPVIIGLVPYLNYPSPHALHVVVAGGGSTLAGAAGAWLGKLFASKIETFAGETNRWIRWIPIALSVAFAIGIFACSSGVLHYGLGKAGDAINAVTDATIKISGANQVEAINGNVPTVLPSPSLYWPLVLQVTLAILLILWAWRLGQVNVNRYSMHAIYRNRLSRAFLGSARSKRNSDPFTGFDPEDNPHLVEFTKGTARQRLFPVINMTLNVTAGTNTAWTERKAASFTATPLACGSAALRQPSQPPDQSAPLGAFVPTHHYAGMESHGDSDGLNKGPQLGNALTISGAAASPNWGYHSSRLTAFVMTLFNVRLGAWLPNPAKATPEDLQLAKPRHSQFAFVGELLGRTTDTSQAIYLSDGGHFENLGVYEMLRRRCKRIVLIDAGKDGKGDFFDLGNAIRKAKIDLDVDVEMPQMRIYPRKEIENDNKKSRQARGMALGTVKYRGGSCGEILYIKPSYLDSIPAEVRAYARTDDAFPHDDTLQQWFTESQFESYRALGHWQMEQLDGKSLEELFESARKMIEESQNDE